MANEVQNTIDNAKELRVKIEKIKQVILAFKKISLECDYYADKGEVLANITLAYRHMEDAKMRLGKVIQYSDIASQTDKDN